MASLYFQAGLLGVSAHLIVFIRGEWHLLAPLVVIIHSLAAVVVFAMLGEPGASFQRLFQTTAIILAYLVGLFGSITIYRLFFHRLREFPGPRMAALTKFWHVYQCRSCQGHLQLHKLYQKYGRFVRTGPEEITIFHAEAFDVLDGLKSTSARSDWYDMMHPLASPLFTREKSDHKEYRRPWLHALSTKSINLYLPRIINRIEELKQVIAEHGADGVRINDIMMWHAFDTMGDVGFNKDFGTVRSGEWRSVLSKLEKSLMVQGWLVPAVWFMRLIFILAFIYGYFFPKADVNDWFAMNKFTEDLVMDRMKFKQDIPSISSWVIGEFERKGNQTSFAKRRNLLYGNSITLFVAGSDTTGPSLVALWYFLALYPDHARRLQEEIDTVDTDDKDALAKLPHLNGFINESLRLLHPGPTLGSRQTPSEGVIIGGTYIPGNVKVLAPRYTISRLDSAFVNPDAFIPERWYSHPEMVRDKRAFAPFAAGRRSCVGSALAMTHMRLLLAKLLSCYDVSFAAGVDVAAVEGEMRDLLSAHYGNFSLNFKARELGSRVEKYK